MKGLLPRSLYEKFNADANNVLVLDYQMVDASKSTELGMLFVQWSHPQNLRVILIVQNIFEKGKALNTTNLNSHYLVF